MALIVKEGRIRLEVDKETLTPKIPFLLLMSKMCITLDLIVRQGIGLRKPVQY